MLHVLTKEDNRSLDSTDLSTEVLRHSRRPPGEAGGIVDNYLTRYAAGWSVLGSPTKAGVWGVRDVPPLTWRHFQRALHNLERMQVVLILEEIDAAAPLLRALGLPPYSSETRAGTNFSTLRTPRQLSQRAQRHLERQHEWDLMLYAWARQRHRRTVEAFAQLSPAAAEAAAGEEPG
ncbi:hypothetical protein ABPG75_012917 [Micractinium tetrahymenae]